MTYSTYKKSNIPWIGDIPEHWVNQRIKDCLTFKIGGTPPTKNEEYFEGENIWVSIADINKTKENYIYDSSIKINDDAVRNSNVKLIKKGSLLYSFKLSVGLTTFAGCDLYTNEAIASFEPNNNVDLNFLKYAFQAGFENNAAINIYGAKLFNSDLIKFAKFVMPKSIDEQKQIANYLDKKTAKINKTISKNKKLIELLEEKRTALINEVVTKGLNPDVEMKDSGVEWIGEIPEHWDVTNLKHLANLQTGTTPSKNIGITLDKGINWFTPGDFDNSYKLNYSNKYITSDAIKTNNIKIYPPYSILMVCIGATIGKLGATNDFSYSNQQITAILPKIGVNYKYLLYYLISKTDYIKDTANFTTLPILNNQHLSSFKITQPPEDEQNKIGVYLDYENTKINSIITKIKENIVLLEEYKTSLIHHVVTGKIDVRGEEI